MPSFSGEKALAGGKELDRQLLELRDGLAVKVLRASLRDALKPTLALYKATMRVGTRGHTLTKTYGSRFVGPGFSQRNTYISTQLARDGSRSSATIGFKPPAFYNLTFNETTGFRGGRGGRGKRKGRQVAPSPRLVPAFKATRSVMLTSFTAALRQRIDRIARKKGTAR